MCRKISVNRTHSILAIIFFFIKTAQERLPSNKRSARIVGVVYSNKIFRALPHLLVFPCYSVATIKNITSGSLNQQFNDWYSSKRFRQNCFRRTLAFIILFTILTSLTFVVRHINCKRKRHVWQGLYTKQGYLSFRLVER